MNRDLGYKAKYEKKKELVYSRMDDPMINQLREISNKTGISISEIIRDAVRRLLFEVNNSGNYSIQIK